MKRPIPPSSLFDDAYPSLIPADDVLEWALETFIREGSPLHNPDHWHLEHADLKFMWASNAFTKKGRTVLGQCEELMARAGGWQKIRFEQQFREWFGEVPQFIITLAADYSLECSDLEFCALVEHELYHIAQEIDEFRIPKFIKKTGLPKLCMRGHDVEEFNGVVRRYGANEQVKEMINAANEKPKIGLAKISQACGNCILKLA